MDDGLDELFDNDTMACCTRAEMDELKRLAALGQILDEADKSDKRTEIILGGSLLPALIVHGDMNCAAVPDLPDAWRRAKAAR